jgi:hypothetical protein
VGRALDKSPGGHWLEGWQAFAASSWCSGWLQVGLAESVPALKMLFPIVVFILPVLLVITLVPGMLSVLKDLQLLGR